MRLTRVKSRWVVTAAGVIMILLGLLPKAAAVVAAIPAPVLGGASLAMFANVAVVGIQTLRKVDLHDNRNSVIVATSLGLALLVTLQPSIAEAVPGWATILVSSGVTLGSIVAILLNLLFFHTGGDQGPDVAVRAGRPVSLAEVNAMDHDEFVEIFSVLFPQTWPVEQVWGMRPFPDAAELRDAFQQVVLTADETRQRELIAAYHDISELLIPHETASVDVQALQEISSLAMDGLDDADQGQIRAISEAYRERHGLPWVVAMSEIADRSQLLDSGWHRVEASPARELVTAITEVGRIFDARFDALVADANPIRSAWARKFEQLD